MATEYKLAGLTFTLKKIRHGIHSEETPDYMADLYCGKDLIAHVSNDGHGGCTFAHWNPEKRELAKQIEERVRKEVWITCDNGDKIYHDLGTVADEIFDLIERNKIIARNQKKGLVLEKEDEIGFSVRKYNMTIEEAVARFPEQVKKEIAKYRAEGYTIVNTNLPAEFLQ